ncbi:uncharacterized protein B0H64DRAFT_175373 [Chaetomium fimeti]|uniref:Uncharacterized protein n=1 Tax=Chaetomium fimeti TaxID=1854472 RepID=A0AAE0HE27_9PEZI|nr:hypothetical protein B0H64DRAFT_175373 [Chaetomium fimeti]
MDGRCRSAAEHPAPSCLPKLSNRQTLQSVWTGILRSGATNLHSHLSLFPMQISISPGSCARSRSVGDDKLGARSCLLAKLPSCMHAYACNLTANHDRQANRASSRREIRILLAGGTRRSCSSRRAHRRPAMYPEAPAVTSITRLTASSSVGSRIQPQGCCSAVVRRYDASSAGRSCPPGRFHRSSHMRSHRRFIAQCGLSIRSRSGVYIYTQNPRPSPGRRSLFAASEVPLNSAARCRRAKKMRTDGWSCPSPGRGSWN